MFILQAILLGIIEGLTEFLPISSTGHLIVAERVIGYKDTAEIFTVVIQVGAIAAVLWFYRQDIWQKVRGLVHRNTKTVRFWQNLVIATIPAGLAGLAAEKKLGSLATLPVIAVSLVIGGVYILWVESLQPASGSSIKPKLEQVTRMQALKIGLFQVLSLVPGVSRSGATIMGGLVNGLDRVTATTFSFYLSLPILFLASGYKIIKGRHDLATVPGGASALMVGTLATFVVAFGVVGWLLKYISHNNFRLFAYYRIAFGILILLVLAIR